MRVFRTVYGGEKWGVRSWILKGMKLGMGLRCNKKSFKKIFQSPISGFELWTDEKCQT
jgi:hypothetical protein